MSFVTHSLLISILFSDDNNNENFCLFFGVFLFGGYFTMVSSILLGAGVLGGYKLCFWNLPVEISFSASFLILSIKRKTARSIPAICRPREVAMCLKGLIKNLPHSRQKIIRRLTFLQIIWWLAQRLSLNPNLTALSICTVVIAIRLSSGADSERSCSGTSCLYHSYFIIHGWTAAMPVFSLNSFKRRLMLCAWLFSHQKEKPVHLFWPSEP